ncbi:DNA/RNA nuclease SfsA [Hydrocarboniclastica marina]|uniref:Sugar fermentation stimulation protein homolog n=1 Tax=Hydrocarboniclastica marina TaxID=2259620 RepID=A0A4P7XMB2_9ALTE|nr:DNA/RNA nuclease SfsA [Hydrocarboniclastica marina]QCF27784.1 DNA/RNA nuclease SfsA [Hydrocarboniclastica marina]
MDFSTPLQPALLERRYKRFLADVVLESGERTTVHCANTGSMLGCAEPGSRVWLSRATNPNRKLAFTWELVELDHGHLACINTARPNSLVAEAIAAGRVTALQGYRRMRREVKYGDASRVDLWLGEHVDGRPDAWVEVKSVTLGSAGRGRFPDAVTLRGQKHLRELAAKARLGERAVLFFCVSHTGIDSVRPADDIDPVYGRTLREAVEAGVEVMAWRLTISPTAMNVDCPLPVLLESAPG